MHLAREPFSYTVTVSSSPDQHGASQAAGGRGRGGGAVTMWREELDEFLARKTYAEPAG
jgi:hypothetical protein